MYAGEMKIGFICLPLSGHVLPMTSLMRKLQSRGHEVFFLGVPDYESIVRDADLSFLECCARSFPRGSMPGLWQPIASMQGLEIMQYAMTSIFPKLIAAALKELPAILLKYEIDALVVDTAFFYVQLAAMSVKVPFVQVSLALHTDATGTTPPSIFSWPYETSPEALARNLEGLQELGKLLAPNLQIASEFAERAGLSLDWTDPGATASKLAIITQTPREFDFPIVGLPSQWHYAGPFHDGDGRRAIPFPWDELDQRPLVYVSLGTVVNGQDRLYRTVLEALVEMQDLQVVVSAGNSAIAEGLREVSPRALIVEQVPQLELLKRTALCITHGGLNTVLEALAQGVPMIAVPIGFDQPGVAARIAYHHVGEFIQVDELTTQGLSAAVRQVLDQAEYRVNACRFQEIIARNRGLDAAADAVEHAFADTANEVRVFPAVHGS